MAAIIIFSNLWGLFLREWRPVNRRTRTYLWLGIVLLIISVAMIGIGDGLARDAELPTDAISQLDLDELSIASVKLP
jgi:L-rhamnose-H+ transport protein